MDRLGRTRQTETQTDRHTAENESVRPTDRQTDRPELSSMCSAALHDISDSAEQAAVVIIYLAAHDAAAVRECE